jgi:hypothetical protein
MISYTHTKFQTKPRVYSNLQKNLMLPSGDAANATEIPKTRMMNLARAMVKK